MSGLVGIPANDAARYTLFFACLSRLQAPPNTTIEWAFGSDRIRGRNNIVRQALRIGSEWVWFLDDDHAFAPSLLSRLLAHEVPVVAALYLQRMAPFSPIAYTDRADDGTYTPLFLPDYEPGTSLIEIRAAGTGGMLIRSEVFHALDDPWFEHGEASEDLIFCEKAREAGFPIHCDISAHLGHITSGVVWPSYDEDSSQWTVGFAVADSVSLEVPIGTREQLAEMEARQAEARAPVQTVDAL